MDSKELESKFISFYEEVNHFSPYKWQIRLMRQVAETGHWPDKIDAPTGAGKTSVIEVHVFVNALAGWRDLSGSIPRRLCLAVNRRALVDSQYDHALHMRETLVDGNASEIASFVIEGLLRRQGKELGPEGVVDAESLLRIVQMRGGMDANDARKAWRLYPEAPMIICATPDMFGSRLLFHGYGTSKYARPQEAGLLAYDTALVIDEAHLNQQLARTARRVAELERNSRLVVDKEFSPQPLQVVESSATLGEKDLKEETTTSVSVTQEDFAFDLELAKRLEPPKKISTVLLGGSDTERILKTVQLCEELSRARGGAVAVILNTVSHALKVSKQLRKKQGESNVVCVVGRMRPYDRNKAVKRLMDASGDGMFIVGTQALEVGINYDCCSMVTELAPASSLVQRFGRLNRFGRYADGKATVLVPEDLDSSNFSGSPYQAEDLRYACNWIKAELPEEGASALWFSSHSIEAASGRRLRYQRLEAQDVEFFSHTSECLSAETGRQNGSRADLDLWLRDELGDKDDHDVSLVIRDALPKDGICARDLLAKIPPLPDEEYPCSLGQIRRIIETFLADEAPESAVPRRAFFSEDGEAFCAVELDGKGHVPREDLKPGNMYVFDAEAADFFQEGTVIAYSAKHRGEGACAKSVYNELLVLEDFRIPFLLDERDGILSQALTTIEARTIVAQFRGKTLAWAEDEDQEMTLDELVQTELVKPLKDALPAESPLKGSLGRIDIQFERDESGAPTDVYIICQRSIDNDSETGYEVSSGTGVTVPLVRHEEDVGKACLHLANAIGIGGAVSEALVLSGQLHDEGKNAPRFQELLHTRPGSTISSGTILAKSAVQDRSSLMRMREKLDLIGWRHEQLSAAMVWGKLNDSSARELVTRLVGTSHGRGRDTFAMAGSQLISAVDKDDLSVELKKSYGPYMAELFDKGAWEALIGDTNKEYGIWGVAYLEAILRAADCRVSAGGRLWN